MSIEEQVKQVIAKQLNIKDLSTITPEASFTEDLAADSLDKVELLMAFEEEFDFQITDEEAEKITTVQSAIDIIKANAK